MENPYGVLGVPEGAGEAEIRRAYLRLVKRYHPDAHPGDARAADQMARVNAAYALLRGGRFYAPAANFTASPRAAGARRRRVSATTLLAAALFCFALALAAGILLRSAAPSRIVEPYEKAAEETQVSRQSAYRPLAP